MELGSREERGRERNVWRIEDEHYFSLSLQSLSDQIGSDPEPQLFINLFFLSFLSIPDRFNLR